jgi:DNA modification methylase
MTTPRQRLLRGDALTRLAALPDNSIDSIVTDPPYEINFMGKGWDGSGIANNPALWAECLRVLKPGGHLLSFGATRTYHRMAVAIEDAGFEIRDSIHWSYGSGFPKSLNVGKAIDKAGDDDAKTWDGWGTALKPSHEPIVVARKPLGGTVAANVLAHGTGALNIDGCRVLHASAADRAESEAKNQHKNFGTKPGGNKVYGDYSMVPVQNYDAAQGRWPANTVLTHAAGCQQTGTRTLAGDKRAGNDAAVGGRRDGGFADVGAGKGDGRPNAAVYGDQTVAAFDCVDGCPVAELDQQSGVSSSKSSTRGIQGRKDVADPDAFNAKPGSDYVRGHTDSGGASRFFTVTEWDPIADAAPFLYVAKPSKRERNAGLGGLPAKSYTLNRPPQSDVAAVPLTNKNFHPTVKPVALMRHLVRLVTPPGGVVLDPFLGSGTTAVAAILEGFGWVGCEMTDEYVPIIRARVRWAKQQTAVTQTQGQPPAVDDRQPPLPLDAA